MESSSLGVPPNSGSRYIYECGDCGAQYHSFDEASACGCGVPPPRQQVQDIQLQPSTSVGSSVKKDATKDVRSWTGNQTRLLMAVCSEHLQSAKATKSKQDLRSRWESVENAMKVHGYELSWEECRKKWYRLVQKYKEVKEGKQRSGGGANTWEFFDTMDSIHGKDPSITPQHVIGTSPLSEKPINVPKSVHIDHSVIGQDTCNQDMSMQSCSVETPKSRGQPTRKKRRMSAQETPTSLQDLTNLMKEEVQDRQQYRQQKLKLMERLIMSVEKQDQ